MRQLQQQPLPAKSRRRDRLHDSATHGGVSTVARAVVEAMELRVLLSAGDPDLAFGIGGLAAFNLGFGSGPESNSFTFIDMDTRGGKTIAFGDYYGTKHQFGALAVRFNAYGALDQSFGGTGMIGYGDFSPDRVLIQPDGKILVAARTRDGPEVDASFTTPVLVRLNADGGFDTTFSQNGVVELPLQTGALTLDASGGIYIGGSYSNGGEIMVAKYLANGDPDSGFGQAGQFSLETYRGQVYGMTLQPDGGVVVAGPMTYVPIVDGSPAKPSGPALYKFGGTSWSSNMVFLPAGYAPGDLATTAGGKIVVGSMQSGNVRPIRYNANGTFDRSFAALVRGGGGVGDIRLGSDGKLVVFAAGGTDTADGVGIAVRYNTDGSLDKTFAPGLGYRPVAGWQGDLRADNQIIAVGADSGNVYAGQYWYAGGPDPVSLAPAANGTLTINGAGGNDTVRIYAGAISPGGPTVWRVRLNEFYRAVTPSLVKTVVVNAKYGDDVVDLSKVAVPVSIYAGGGVDTVFGGSGNDFLHGGEAFNVIHGGAGNDVIVSGAWDDELYGDAGNDVLDGGLGADLLSGGSGTDTVDYSSRTNAVMVYVDGTGASGADGEHDLVVTDVENINGGAGDDIIRGSSANNVIHGNGGNDTLYGYGGNDTLYGDAGNDKLNGGLGANDMWGGPGTDTVDYGGRVTSVYVNLNGVADDGEAGEHDNARGDIEIVSGGGGNDTLIGNAANNVFYGNGGDDVIYGRGGNDVLNGGPGRDKLYGEDGNDQLFAKDGFIDFLDGGAGYDTATRDLVDSVKGVEKA